MHRTNYFPWPDSGSPVDTLRTVLPPSTVKQCLLDAGIHRVDDIVDLKTGEWKLQLPIKGLGPNRLRILEKHIHDYRVAAGYARQRRP